MISTLIVETHENQVEGSGDDADGHATHHARGEGQHDGVPPKIFVIVEEVLAVEKRRQLGARSDKRSGYHGCSAPEQPSDLFGHGQRYNVTEWSGCSRGKGRIRVFSPKSIIFNI